MNLSFSNQLKIFLYSQPCDMRKGFDGLYGLVTNEMELDPIISISFSSNDILNIGESTRYIIKITDTQSEKSFEETVVLKRKFGFANGMQKKITWLYNPNINIDSSIVNDLFTLVGNNDCTTSKCASDWIKSSKYFITEKTGLIENEKLYWIHPPRSKYFRIMEFAPFPFFDKVNHKYSDTITLGKGWGQFKGKVVVSNYERENKDEKILIKGNSSSLLGEVNSIFIFDEIKGFVNIRHNFFDKYIITMTLKD